MTRSHKYTDRDYSVNAPQPEEHLPRYFAKSGHAGADPTKTKKAGAGKGNWGREGDEVEDYGFTMANQRRRSNSSSHQREIKTKFETVEHEPVFEEEIHGAPIEQTETASSTTSSQSVEEEEGAKKHA